MNTGVDLLFELLEVHALGCREDRSDRSVSRAANDGSAERDDLTHGVRQSCAASRAATPPRLQPITDTKSTEGARQARALFTDPHDVRLEVPRIAIAFPVPGVVAEPREIATQRPHGKRAGAKAGHEQYGPTVPQGRAAQPGPAKRQRGPLEGRAGLKKAGEQGRRFAFRDGASRVPMGFVAEYGEAS